MKYLKEFIKYAKPHRKLFFIDLFCAVLSSGIYIAFPLAMNYGLNEFLPQGKFTEFFLLVLGVIAAYLVNWGLGYVISYLGHVFGLRVEVDMRAAIFDHLQKMSFSYFDKTKTGEIMSRVTNDLFEMTEIAHHGPEDLLVFILVFVGGFSAMAFINLYFALAIIWLVPLSVIFMISRKKHTKGCSRDMKEKLAIVNSGLESSVAGVRVTQSFTNAKYEKAKFKESNEKFLHSKGNFYKEFAFFHSSLDFNKNLLKISVVLCGGILFLFDQASLADIITFNLFITSMIQPIQKLLGFSEIFISGMAGFERFYDFMHTPPDIVDKEDAKELANVQGEIEFKGVDFTYDGEDFLYDINFTLKRGETVALVGKTGAGKSTICQLIPRFYDICKGNITIDGVDIRDVTMESLRKNIGVVQQDVHIFSDTIMNNVLYGRPIATEDEVISALKMAELYEDVVAMENGLYTFVGEKGAKLSGGQKQRLSIARMFLKNPPIIIFDEATSALDTVTEEKIQSAIDKLSHGRTIIVIAHRLSTIRNADNIIVVDAGKIKEQGTHSELLKNKGIYAKMYEVIS